VLTFIDIYLGNNTQPLNVTLVAFSIQLLMSTFADIRTQKVNRHSLKPENDNLHLNT